MNLHAGCNKKHYYFRVINHVKKSYRNIYICCSHDKILRISGIKIQRFFTFLRSIKSKKSLIIRDKIQETKNYEAKNQAIYFIFDKNFFIIIIRRCSINILYLLISKQKNNAFLWKYRRTDYLFYTEKDKKNMY